MNKFSEKLRRRRLYVIAVLVIAIVLFAVLAFTIGAGPTDDHTTSFMSGFRFGIFAAVVGISIVNIVQITRALRDQDKMKALYIREHDEREILIAYRSTRAAFFYSLIILSFAVIAASFINPIVFATLLITLAVFCLMNMGCAVYYRKKL